MKQYILKIPGFTTQRISLTVFTKLTRIYFKKMWVYEYLFCVPWTNFFFFIVNIYSDIFPNYESSNQGNSFDL